MPDQVDAALGAPSASHIETIDHLSHDLQKLVAGCQDASLRSDVREDIERLTSWIATYRAGLEAAKMINQTASETLGEARKELDLAYQQILILEDEGGNVATPKQQRQTEALSKALRRVNTLIPVLATTIADPAAPQPATPQPEITPPEQSPGAPTEVPAPMNDPETAPDTAPVIPPVTDPDM